MQITKILKSLKLAFISGLLFTALTPALVNASWIDQVRGNITPTGEKAYAVEGEPKDIRVIVAGLIEIVLGLIGTIFVILIVAAGFKWMTAQGDSKKIQQAVGTIQMASIGLLIVLAALGLTVFIARSAIGVTGDQPPYQYQND